MWVFFVFLRQNWQISQKWNLKSQQPSANPDLIKHKWQGSQAINNECPKMALFYSTKVLIKKTALQSFMNGLMGNPLVYQIWFTVLYHFAMYVIDKAIEYRPFLSKKTNQAA